MIVPFALVLMLLPPMQCPNPNVRHCPPTGHWELAVQLRYRAFVQVRPMVGQGVEVPRSYHVVTPPSVLYSHTYPVGSLNVFLVCEASVPVHVAQYSSGSVHKLGLFPPSSLNVSGPPMTTIWEKVLVAFSSALGKTATLACPRSVHPACVLLHAASEEGI